jgi:excisionase family DNA binding protein
MSVLSERHIRIPEFARRTGLATGTVRKFVVQRRIAFHKIGRCVVIPESEVLRLLGERREPINLMGRSTTDGPGATASADPRAEVIVTTTGRTRPGRRVARPA